MGDATPAYSGWEERSTARVLDSARRRAVEQSRRIVAAAREIVAESGLDGLTVQKVRERTGLSLRAFYQRFVGKDDLLLAVFEETMRDAAASFAVETAPVSDPVGKLRVLVTGIFTRGISDDVMKQSVPLSREHLRLAESRPEELRFALEPLTVLLAEQLAAAMEAGVVRRTDPRRLAVLVLNLVFAQVHAVVLGTAAERDVERSGAELWEFCWRAVEVSAQGLVPSGTRPPGIRPPGIR
jgi:AcrR family transcriptional regulator